MKHVLDVVYHNATLVAWSPATSHLHAQFRLRGGAWGVVKYIACPVLVNKGWGVGVVKYIACARCGLSYYLPTPAHPV